MRPILIPPLAWHAYPQAYPQTYPQALSIVGEDDIWKACFNHFLSGCFQRLWSLCNDCNRCSSPYLPNQPHPHKTNFNNLRWNSIQRQTVSTLPRDNLSSTAQYHFFPCSSIFDGYKDLSRSRLLRNIRISKFREGLEGSSLAAKAIWAKYYRIVQCYSNINY